LISNEGALCVLFALGMSRMAGAPGINASGSCHGLALPNRHMQNRKPAIICVKLAETKLPLHWALRLHSWIFNRAAAGHLIRGQADIKTGSKIASRFSLPFELIVIYQPSPATSHSNA
jgi:hypothetical protein